MNIEKIFAKVKNSVVRVETGDGSGSGIIVDERGIVLTNCHVVELKNIAALLLYNGRIDFGRVIYSNRIRDIAFLYVNLRNLPVAKLNYSPKMKIGEEIIAIGHPAGLPYSVTMGIISYPTRIIEEEPGLPYIQYDAVTNFGSSGGPIIDQKGKVIGIACKGKGQSEGLNLAIPTSDIKSYILDVKNRFGWYKSAKYCSICGNANDYNNKFCQTCGSTLTTNSELNNEINEWKSLFKEKLVCKNCMNINPKENMKCNFCGAILRSLKTNAKNNKKDTTKNIACPVCEKINNMSEQYCTNCGVRLVNLKKEKT